MVGSLYIGYEEAELEKKKEELEAQYAEKYKEDLVRLEKEVEEKYKQKIFFLFYFLCRLFERFLPKKINKVIVVEEPPNPQPQEKNVDEIAEIYDNYVENSKDDWWVSNLKDEINFRKKGEVPKSYLELIKKTKEDFEENNKRLLEKIKKDEEEKPNSDPNLDMVKVENKVYNKDKDYYINHDKAEAGQVLFDYVIYNFDDILKEKYKPYNSQNNNLTKVKVPEDSVVRANTSFLRASKVIVDEIIPIQYLKEWEDEVFCNNILQQNIKMCAFVKKISLERLNEIHEKFPYYTDFIRNLKEPSFEVEKRIVNLFGIRYLPNPSDEICIYALNKSSLNMSRIRKPSLYVQKKVINLRADGIRFIKDPCEEVCIYSVSKYADSIRFINNPSVICQKIAIEKSVNAIRYIKKPGVEVLEYCLKIHPCLSKYIRLGNEEKEKEKEDYAMV
jgi:hypothetical protein